MRHFTTGRARWLTLSTGGIALATIVAAVGLTGSASANGGTASGPLHPTAHVAQSTAETPDTPITHTVKAMTQEFTRNTKYFCDGTAPNPRCDGAPGDFGTIDRVASGFTNGGYGNYAPSTKALYKGYMALVSGSGDKNQGVGCPTPGAEACSGPYALFGTGTTKGVYNVFPKGGFTVTDDLYLSPSTAPTPGSLVDDDVELNTSSGLYGIDNVITACPETSGFVINFSHASPGSCAGTPVVTTAGWYRFVFDFSNVAGDAYLTESVLSESTQTVVATSGPLPENFTSSTPVPITSWGGPGYFWLPTEDISGLPLANFALQLGQHHNGHTP